MQHRNNRNESVATTKKTAWKKPTVSRIDIKRTLAGLSGTNDGTSPSGKTA